MSERATSVSDPSFVLHIGNKRYSSWSLRGYLAMAASGAPFTTHMVWLDQPESHANLLRINPAGRVPALDHGDLRIHDSLAIAEYLHELYPDAHLWPSDRAARAVARSITAEMHSGFAALRREMPMDLLSSLPGTGHTPEALADAARVMDIWRQLRAAHRAAGPYLFGHFTIADAFYAPVTTRFTTYGVAVDDVCGAYVDAIAAHPAFRDWKADAAHEPVLPDHR